MTSLPVFPEYFCGVTASAAAVFAIASSAAAVSAIVASAAAVSVIAAADGFTRRPDGRMTPEQREAYSPRQGRLLRHHSIPQMLSRSSVTRSSRAFQ